MINAALYHFTNKSEKRPIVCQKQIEELKQYAASIGLSIAEDDIYLDKSINRTDHTEFRRFMDNCDKYTALVTKDFYHIAKNTIHSFKILKELNNKGIHTYTMLNGAYITDNPPFDKSLRIATYDFISEETEKKELIQSINEERFQLFTRMQTNWQIIDSYADTGLTQNNGEQTALAQLIKNRDKYDLILILDFSDIHRHTARFCHKRESIGLDIYSLMGGYLRYTEPSL